MPKEPYPETAAQLFDAFRAREDAEKKQTENIEKLIAKKMEENALLNLSMSVHDFHFEKASARVIVDDIHDEIVIRSPILPTNTRITVKMSLYDDFVGNMKSFVAHQLFKFTRVDLEEPLQKNTTNRGFKK